ncbi:minor tail protein [Gordonia phage Goib]|uniref:Minor tail protein n=2 Tax=Vendettavirus vendetta TaxID=2049886 RepID=A0A160DCZ2_9CAUD|nr:minor tail protein [Gordonia phage Vendetta]YP_009275377.1 minor tail protein [Gordonia phage Splinter]ANA85570.1 minor tail protein [Gordonia phage Vendetta]ANA85649.1 minor tail protein [Gordonia phage Splinter]WNO25767.1 minor tail protein [Gordonia phage Goib]
MTGAPLLGITYYDHSYNELGTIGDYLTAEVEWKRNDVGGGTLVIPSDSPHVARLKECAPTKNRPHGDVVPITVKYRGERWSGRVLTYDDEGVTGQKDFTCQLVSDWYHMRALLAYPNPLLPLMVQWPQNDPFIGPIDAAVKYYVFKNIARTQLPIEVLWPDGREFFKLRNYSNFMARMAPMDELFRDALKDTDANVTLSLWLPGDPQPSPETHRLTRPCIVLDVKPNRDRRYVKWSDRRGGGIAKSKVSGKAQTAAHIIVGGKSYDFLNDLIAQGANVAINAALTYFGLAGVGNIITDQLDDVFMAFNRFDHWETVLTHGRFYFREAYQNGGAGGFTADAVQAGMQGIHEHKARRTVRFEVVDGMPWTFGEDFTVGDLVIGEIDDEEHEQVVNEAKVRDSREGAVEVSLVIGDDDVGEHPIARQIRRYKQTEKWVKAMSLAS